MWERVPRAPAKPSALPWPNPLLCPLILPYPAKPDALPADPTVLTYYGAV